jgi:hypothetical protein
MHEPYHRPPQPAEESMSKKKLAIATAVTAILLMPLLPAPTRADDDHWRHGDDIHHFDERDRDHWRGGRWFHGPHEGREGWWWIVDGSWYFYPAPVYPYPDPYVPPVVVAPAPAPAAPPPSSGLWYYCPNPAGYYPYVQQCPVPWTPVRPSP